MDLNLLRQLDPDYQPESDKAQPGAPGRSTLTSRLTPAPQVIFRVADPETARALGESLSGGHHRVQREADGGGGPARDANGVAEGAEQAVERASGSSGSPLPEPVRARFESSLGADLSNVRVHTGAASTEANQAVGARAYTVGNDIHFNAGQYQPDDPFGMHLLAHEVAHTVQQAGSAPTRQHKLEVSTPNDAAEVEADRAADAMVAGQSTTLTSASGVARQTLFRDEEIPIVIGPDQPLNQTLYDAQVGTQQNIAENWDFNSQALVDPKTGEANTKNEVAKNLAKKSQKTQEEFKRLTEEMDTVRPLTEAYMLAQTNVDTINATGIDANNPEAYRSDVLAMHEAMDKKTSTNTNASNASSQLTNLWSQAKTAKDVVSATKKVSALSDELQMAKNELTKVQNNLLAAKAKDEIKSNQAQLDKIDAKVKQIAGIITGIAKVTAAVASMAATGGATAPTAMDAIASTMTMEQSFALVAMQNAHDAEQEANAGNNKAAAAMGHAGKAADWVGGKGDMIEQGLKSFVFKEQIDGFKSKIGALEGEISALGIANEGLSTANVVKRIDMAQKNYEALSAELANSKDKFQQSMQDVGRYFDRMHIDDKTPEGKAEAAVKEPGIAPGRKVSMESLMGLYAALQKRGAARGALKDMLKNCKTIADAKRVMAAGLDDSAGHPLMVDKDDPFGVKVKDVAMDEDFTGIGLRSKAQVSDAAQVRRTVAAVLQVVDHVAARDEGEGTCEAAWEKMINQAMAGIKK